MLKGGFSTEIRSLSVKLPSSPTHALGDGTKDVFEVVVVNVIVVYNVVDTVVKTHQKSSTFVRPFPHLSFSIFSFSLRLTIIAITHSQ